MKILIVNTYDLIGGAARATNRLHNGLLKLDIDSKFIVNKKTSNDTSIIQINNNLNSNFFDDLILKNYAKPKSPFSNGLIQNQNLITYINNSDADIVHLHWISYGFLAIEDISNIEKPIIWTMHDNWLFTGGCHIMESCTRYKENCGKCNILESTDKKDISYINLNIKKRVFNNLENFYCIGLSKWLTHKAKESSVLKDVPIYNLPNTIDVTIFTSRKTINLREKYNLSKNKKIILFGSMLTSERNKGFHFLKEALLNLKEVDIELIVFGDTPNKENIFPFKTIYTNIKNDDTLIDLYNCADITIVPSIQENFSNTILESLSCSTPVIAFNIGGNSDMIEHKKNGYLVKPFDVEDLTKGIKWVLTNPKYKDLCENARKKVVKSFSEEIVIPKYIELYQKVIHNTKIPKKKNPQSKKTTLINMYANAFNIHLSELSKNKELDFSIKYNKLFSQITNLKYTTIIIYGYGTIGKTIQNLIPEKVIAFVDKTSENISKKIIRGEVYNPKNLSQMRYDKIIISVLGREKEIIQYLTNELKLNKNKIIILNI